MSLFGEDGTTVGDMMVPSKKRVCPNGGTTVDKLNVLDGDFGVSHRLDYDDCNRA